MLLSLLDIIRVMTSKGMRQVGHGEDTGEIRNACSLLVRNPEAKKPLE
jgi:hypothetical protein